MKFTAASVFAVVAAFAPSLVSAAEITVFVGASKNGTTGIRFDPQQITAEKGDIVNFEFRGGNHTVTQSSFANPCAWQFNTVTNEKGFNSGFLPFVNTSGQVSVYSLKVNDPSSPIWFFCGRLPHCKNGMFGAINAPTTGNKTFEKFAANVLTTDALPLNTTVPFTPSNAIPSPSSSSSSSPAAAVPTTNTNISPPSSAAAAPTSSGATPKPTNAAGSVTAGSTVAVGLAALVAALVF